MNIFIFTGNLGKDSEVRQLPNGTTVCGFSVAVTSGYGDKKKTSWVRCGLFGKRAEGQLPQYLVKGQKVAISGELTLDEWEKDGQKHSALKVNVDSLDLIGDKKPDEAQSQQQQAPQQQQDQSSGFDALEDIPF